MTLNVNQHFVDRGPERTVFARMLSGDNPARVLRVLVQPGHGKSWLVKRLFFDCEENSIPAVWVNFDTHHSKEPMDARYVTERFLESLGEVRLPQVNMRLMEWRQVAPSQNADAYYLPTLGRALRHDLSCWTDTPGAMTDEFTRYETGIATMLERLGRTHPRYLEMVNYQTRLIHENIAVVRLHGETSDLKAERSRILTQINRLTLDEWDILFDALCGVPADVAPPPSPIAVLLDTFEQIPDAARDWLSTWLFDGLRRELAHVRVVVAGRPEPACCAFFEHADLWGHLVANIGQFTPMGDEDILDYLQKRECSLEHVDPNTICLIARRSAEMMAQVGNSLAPGGAA